MNENEKQRAEFHIYNINIIGSFREEGRGEREDDR